jgi:hypothetical protein
MVDMEAVNANFDGITYAVSIGPAPTGCHMLVAHNLSLDFKSTLQSTRGNTTLKISWLN